VQRVVQWVGDEQRRARLALRHHLAPAARGDDVVAVAGDLADLHATVVLSAHARLRVPGLPALEAALYEERSLLRILGMRRTIFIVPVELAPVVHASCTRGLVPGERKRFIAQLQAGGVADDGARWLDETSAATLGAPAARGEASAAELSADVPALTAKLRVFEGKPYAATQVSRGRSSSCSPPAATSPAAARSAPGRASCTAGRRCRPGCPAGSPSSTPTRRRPRSCAAGWRRTGRARWPT